MPTPSQLAAGLLAGCVAAAPAVATGASAQTTAAPADHVVLIALDGFDAKYLQRGVPTPNLDALAQRGSLTRMTGVMPSVTSPGWSSIATGAYPERTLNSAFWYDPSTNRVVGQNRRIAVETLGQVVRAAGRTVAAVQYFVERDRGVSYRDPAALYLQPGGSCGRRVDRATEILTGQPVRASGQALTLPEVPDFFMIHCKELDSRGHKYGSESPIIGRTLEEMDRQVGRLVQATQQAGIYERTVFVVTSDHGMTTFDRAFGEDILAAIERVGLQGEFVRPGTSPAPGTDVVLAGGAMASVHLRKEALADPSLLSRLERHFDRLPHVSEVFDEAEQAGLRMSPVMGELVIEPKPGWTIGPKAPPTPDGQHGTTFERSVPLLLAGSGVLPGAPPRSPQHVDIAPTLAHLLGVPAPSGAQGRVLAEALAGG